MNHLDHEKKFRRHHSMYTILNRNRSFVCVMGILFVVCCDRCGGFFGAALVLVAEKNQFVHVVLCVAF